METEQGDLKREQERLERERQKLLEAHYAGAVPIDLLKREQERISRALRKIGSQLAATSLEFEAVELNLQLALDLTVDCGAAYHDAPEHIKRMFNQAFFEKVLVIQEDASIGDIRVEAEFREPFGTLFGSELKTAGNVKSIWPQRDHLIWPHPTHSSENLGCRKVQGCHPLGKLATNGP